MEKTRELFLGRLIELLEKNTVAKSEVYSTTRYKQLINDIKKLKKKYYRDAADDVKMREYTIITENGFEKLAKQVGFNDYKYYVREDDLYDVILETHLKLNHADSFRVLNQLKLKYVNIPEEIIKLCLSFCQKCSMHTRNEIVITDSVHDDNISSNVNHSSDSDDVIETADDVSVIDISDDEDDLVRICDGDSEQEKVIEKGTQNVEEQRKQDLEMEKEGTVELVEEHRGREEIEKEKEVEYAEKQKGRPNLESVNNTAVNKSNNNLIEAIPKDPKQTAQNIPHLTNNKTLEEQTDEELCQEELNDVEVCLKWSLYDTNMKKVLSGFFSDELFVDVTIFCDDKSIKCHKVILSASSPHFKKMFSENPCQHPIVFINDLEFWEVRALIDYIYKGEVTVPKHKLESLLDAAEALQIKGLGDPVNNDTKTLKKQRIQPKRTNCIRKFVKVNQECQSDIMKCSNSHKSTDSVGNETVSTQTVAADQLMPSNNYISPHPITNTGLYTVYSPAFFPTTNNQITSQSIVPVVHNKVNVSPEPLRCSSSTQTNFDLPIKTNISILRSSFTQTNDNKIHHQSTHSLEMSSDKEYIEDNTLKNETSSKNKNDSQINKEDPKHKTKKRGRKRKCDIQDRIASLRNRGNTEIVFTRKVTAELKSIATRTRKQSQKRKTTKKRRFD